MTAASTTGEVVRGVRDLAARRGWKPVEELATAILSSGSQRQILLAHGTSVDAVPLRDWIQQVTGQSEIARDSIERIGAPPLRALFASKLVAVFECGRVLEAREVRAVVEQFLPRPIESIAIVFTRAERLESREDLDLMERAVWRVVVPDPKRDWQHQDLLAYQCYFWAASPPKEFLHDRCRRDRDELAAVLRRPIDEADAEVLDRARAICLLDFAEGHAPACRPRGNGEQARLLEARNEIAEVVRRMALRLDADAAGLGRQATASLLRLEQDLLQRVEETGKSQTGLWKDGSVPRLQFQKLLERRIEEGMAAWRKDLEAELNQRVVEITAETQGLLRRIDWALVNGIAGNPDRPPAQALSVSPAARIPELGRPLARREEKWTQQFVEATAAAGLTSITALCTGLLPTIVVSSIVVAALVQRQRGQTFEQFAGPARIAIHDMTKRAIPAVRGAIHAAIAEYRDRMISSLRETGAGVESAWGHAGRAPAGEPSADWDREQLLLYRRRL